MVDTILYQNYCNELQDRRTQISEERWQNVLLFRKYLLRQKEVQETTIHHTWRKLSDSFFKREKQRFISRPNFCICLKEHECKIPSSIASLIYNSFDIQKKNAFDWRTFIFMLHITCRSVNENAKNHVKFAFRCYVGHLDDINAPCESRIELKNLGAVLEMLIRPDRVNFVVQSFDNILIKSSITKDTMEKIAFDGSLVSCISYEFFAKVLEKMAIFEGVNSDNGLEVFEREYYPMTLFKHRRCSRLMSQFITTCTTKAKIDSLQRWREASNRRRRVRSLFHSLSKNISFFLLSNAFATLWNNTIMHSVAIRVQCTYRCYSAKVKATMKQIIKASAIMVQKVTRGFIARKHFSIMKQKRVDTIVTIQRFIRGALGRDLAHHKLLTLIDLKLLESIHEKEIWDYNQVIQCAINMQRMFRETSSRLAFKRAVEKKQREMKVAVAMKAMQSEEEAEERIHSQQLQTHAKNALDELQIKEATEENIIQAKNKVQKLHLKMIDERQIAEEKLRQQREIEYREITREKLRDEWKQKEKRDCETFANNCLNCVRAPETSSERRFGREIKTKIKRRISDVLRRADSRQVKIEIDEAKVIAEKEVIHILVEGERARIYDQMEQACTNLEIKLEKDFIEKENLKKKQQASSATWTLVSAVRRWLARKELRLRCLETFEKEFDERYQAFYYRNMKTGEVSWDKPRALGHFDLPTDKSMESIYHVDCYQTSSL